MYIYTIYVYVLNCSLYIILIIIAYNYNVYYRDLRSFTKLQFIIMIDDSAATVVLETYLSLYLYTNKLVIYAVTAY